MRSQDSFYQVVSAAIKDFAANGYDSEQRLDVWLDRIRRSAALSMTPPHVMQDQLRRTLMNVYTRMVENKGALKMHSGVGRFTIDRVKPQLRGELERRIAASANLIKLNRQEAMEKTLRRFSGWATSIPPGGSEAIDKKDESIIVRKALSSLPYAERRVMIDQGHRMIATINDVIAVDGGAIALIWHSHWRQSGYNYREDHKERDGKVYLLPNSWALEKSLVKPGPAGWYDQITHVAEEINCRCFAQFLYTLRSLPQDMLTARGKLALEEGRKTVGRAA